MRQVIEQLERRRLLSGITIITHGWNSDSHSWVSEMGNAIARAIVAPSGDPTTVAQYTVSETATNASAVSVTRDAGPADWGASGEAIIKLDWASLSGGIFSGTPTGAVADAFADYLFTHPLDGHSIFEEPIHLIGHSRGASLNTELARRLAARGIWVDEFTSLDPHPVDGVNEDISGMNFGDTPMSLWSNVEFADNYWHTDTDPLDFNGEAVTGAVNVSFSGSILKANATGYSYAHLYTHLWYHGTIGPETSPFATYSETDGSATITNDSAYYSGSAAQPLRTGSGFYYSAIENGVRPASGIGTPFGGSGARVTTMASGTQWPDVGDLSLRYNTSGTIVAGEQAFLQYRYQDADSAATISFYADNDTNPYDAGAVAIGTAQDVSMTGASVLRGLFHASTSGLASGVWHLYARIGDANGQTRYAYLPQAMTITSAAAAGTLISGTPISSALAAAGVVDVYSFLARTGDSFSLSLSNQGSPVDPEIDLYDSSGNLITTATSSGTATINSMLASSSGEYYVVARDQGDDEAGAYSLSLSLTPANLASVLGNSGDRVYLRKSATDNGAVDAWINSATPGVGNPTMSVGISTLASINLLGGDDELTLDFSGGLPLSANSTIDGGSGTNDRLIVLGTSGSDTISFGASSLTFGANTATLNNIELASFDGQGGSDALSIGARVVSIPTGQRLASISVTSGQLDLGTNWLITDTAVGSWNGSAYTGVSGLIAGGRIGSAAVTSSLYAVGVASATTLLNIQPTGSGTWNGTTVLGSQTLAMYTYGGDATLDGKLNIDDYVKIDAGIAAGETGWVNGDFNYDGKINIDDYTILDTNIGTQGPPILSASGAGAGAAAGVWITPPSLQWGDAVTVKKDSAELLG